MHLEIVTNTVFPDTWPVCLADNDPSLNFRQMTWTPIGTLSIKEELFLVTYIKKENIIL